MADVQLGSLEREIMQAMWARDGDGATVHDILEVINADRYRPLAYNTVMSVMSRLAEKQYLDRERSGRAHVYRAALTGPSELARPPPAMTQL